MEFVPFEKGIEVNGRTVWSIVDGFGEFKLLGSQFVLEEGIGRLTKDGEYELELDGWYPQDAFLRAFQRASTVGALVLRDIGATIPRNAEFPQWVKDIHDGIRSIDIAYHMNHRLNGREMLDRETGAMTEGIGHYGYEPVGDRRIMSRCENPYPCSFDHGLLAAMARRFEPQATVTHDKAGPCRAKGGGSCRYEIVW